MILTSGLRAARVLRAVVLMWGVSVLPAAAGQATVSWDANPETDIAGYFVSYGTTPGQYLFRFDAGPRTSFTFHGLTEGQAFYFVVQAYNRAGLISPTSSEVSLRLAGAPPADSDGDGMPDAWEGQYALSSAAADADGDGASNLSEYHLGTDPTLPNSWQLAEGSTGFFSERIALANPDASPADVSVTYLREAGAPVVRDYVVPGQGRLTIDVNAIAGLEQTAVSALVSTRRGGVVAERTMAWDQGGAAGAHTAKGVLNPSHTWYFAEGSAGFFDTWLLVANPNAAAADVTMTFLREDATTVATQYTVAPNSRFTVFANAIAGLEGRGFSTTISSSVPVTAERAMYFGRPTWNGGHGSAGATSPSRNWFVAEGRTGGFFDTFLLLANPNGETAGVTINYLLPGGGVVSRSLNLAPTSRTTIYVNDVPELPDTDVSASIASTEPIIVERAMYWPRGNWTEAHDSLGLTSLGTEWLLAEGEFGGGAGYSTYVLLSNPSGAEALVTLRFLRENGQPPITLQRVVPAAGRVTVSAVEADGLNQGERFGVSVSANQPIAVERSMYWNGGGTFWGSGTNEVGIRIR